MVVNFRPHIMKWTVKSPEGATTPEGYPVASSPGDQRETPCRYHDTVGNGKVYKNEDSEERVQVGRIRCDIGEVPEEGQHIEVLDIASGALMFKGTVKEIFQGQLSYRINV